MVKSKVLIGVITGEYARRADFYDYYNLLTKPEDTVVIFGHDRSPAFGRNMIIKTAMDNNCTHVLFIDDDMAYKPDALVRLLEHDKDIVSGLYLTRAYPHSPLVFDLANDDGSAFPMYLTDGVNGLVPIVSAGFGFVLIKTSVFAKMEKPYVRLGELDSEQWCDDVGFFHRAGKLGIQMFADLECQVGHMGTMIIWPNRDANGRWYSGYDTNGVSAINTPQIHPEFKYEFVK